MEKNYFVAQEDTNLYNIFSYADFDENGWYLGHANDEGWNLKDFDIVAEFDNFGMAASWVDYQLSRDLHVCCICGRAFKGYGNNPWPLRNYGKCCDKCNDNVVAKRIELLNT